MLSSQFQDPVVDMEHITVHYEQVRYILQDLKNLGVSNATVGRSQGLMGKDKFQAFTAAYEQQRTKEGLLPLTYEVIYGAAFKGA